MRTDPRGFNCPLTGQRCNRTNCTTTAASIVSWKKLRPEKRKPMLRAVDCGFGSIRKPGKHTYRVSPKIMNCSPSRMQGLF